MRTRLAVLLVLLAGVVGIGVWQWRQPPPPESETRAAAVTASPEPERRLKLDGLRSRGALEAALASAYRLPPDRRMVAAAADVRSLLSLGPSLDLARAEWSGDHWTLRCGADAVGALPEYPTFADALALLDGWAKRECARTPLPAGMPEGIATAFLNDYLPEEALHQLDDVAARKSMTRALQSQALAACAQLAVLLAEDRTEFSDTTAARALALLALARARDGTPHVREQCALAWAMGYHEEARAAAAALPAADPLRLLALGRADELQKQVAAAKPSREARLYLLLLLAHRGQLEPWLAIARAARGPGSRGDRAVLSTALGFRRFDVASRIGGSLLAAAFDAAPGTPAEPGADAKTLIAFERAMAGPGAAAHGRLSGGALNAARRAQFYSALAAEHRFLARYLNSPAAVSDMSRRLRLAGSGPGGWFVRWHAHVADAMVGQPDALELRADLGDEQVPAPFALESFDRLTEPLTPATGTSRAAARVLAMRLDTRPRSAYAYAFVAQGTVRWPALTERLLQHAARGLGLDAPGSVILLALLRGDTARLARIVDDPAVEPEDAMTALEVWADADSSGVDALLPRFARLCQRAPASWSLVDGYADLLEARGRFAEAERAVRAWEEVADNSQDALDATFARTAMARLQRKQGRTKEALRTIGDLDRCQQRGAMEEKATLLALSGRAPAALALADSAVARYPDGTGARTFRLLLLWRVGRFAEAARLLARHDADSLYSAHDLANGFADIFRGRPDDALHALAAMRNAAPSATYRVWWIAEAFARAGDTAFAARLVTNSDPGSGAKRALGLATAFDVLARARGEAAAWEWLESQRLGPDARELLGGLLLTSGHATAAYELTAAGEDADLDEYAWLLRAAAWKLDGARRDDWRDAIRTHAPKASPGIYAELTRFMMGERSEKDVLALAEGYKRQNEVWFYCGMRAWGDGRARDTLLWTVLCQEAGATSDGEYTWSYRKLAEWARAWRIAERLPLAVRPPV